MYKGYKLKGYVRKFEKSLLTNWKFSDTIQKSQENWMIEDVLRRIDSLPDPVNFPETFLNSRFFCRSLAAPHWCDVNGARQEVSSDMFFCSYKGYWSWVCRSCKERSDKSKGYISLFDYMNYLIRS